MWQAVVVFGILNRLLVSAESHCPDAEADSVWEYMSDMPKPRALMAGAQIDGAIFILGGNESDSSNIRYATDVLKYHPSADSFSVVFSDISEEFWFASPGQFSFARGSRIHVMGALMPNSLTNHSSPISVNVSDGNFRYDESMDIPASLFEYSNPNYVGHERYCVVYDDSRDVVFISGGYVDVIGTDIHSRKDWVPTNATLVYHFSTGEWKRISNLKQGRYGHMCSLDDGYLYAIGGKYRRRINATHFDQYYITSAERLCVTDDCLQSDDNVWEEVSSVELSPARVWMDSVEAECPFDDGCEDGDRITLITGGYAKIDGSGTVLKYNSVFDAYESHEVQLWSGVCMNQAKSGHLMINDHGNGRVFSFGGYGNSYTIQDKVERLFLDDVFVENGSSSNSNKLHTGIVVAIVVGCGLVAMIIATLLFLACSGRLAGSGWVDKRETMPAYYRMEDDTMPA